MRRSFPAICILLAVVLACVSVPSGEPEQSVETSAVGLISPSLTEGIPTDTRAEQPVGDSLGQSTMDVWDLWQNGPHLRGANLYQRRVYPELDGPTFMGEGEVGPPYTLSDLQNLSSYGANLINVSHPGLFTETPPYRLDPAIQSNLDQLLDLACEADLFVVIAFRTGPGRSEFGFLLDDLGEWFDISYLNDTVWTDEEAQEAWAQMWQYTASRYRDHPALAGYDLMVEPNANEVIFDEWDQDAYADIVHGTSADWNDLYPELADAVREVDAKTPILVEPTGYASVEWLEVLEYTPVDRMVVSIHQYRPFEYTHQAPWSSRHVFPGEFDTDWDGVPDVVDTEWFNTLLSPLDQFKASVGVPMAVNEYGVQRWVPGGAAFLEAELEAFEARGLNSAVWLWEVSYPEYAAEVTAFNVRLCENPDDVLETGNSGMLAVLEKFWALNSVRPSDFSR